VKSSSFRMGGTKKGRRLKVTSPECGLQTFSYYILLTPERARMTEDFSVWSSLGPYPLIAHSICLSRFSFPAGDGIHSERMKVD